MPARARLVRGVLLLFALATVAHFLFAPVPIEPHAFTAPKSRGYDGPFAKNTRLDALDHIELPGGGVPGGGGPEDGAIGPDGLLYLSLRDGTIARMAPSAQRAEAWVHTGGVPLGLDFGPDGTLWVADAYRGLLSIDTKGQVQVRCSTVAGVAVDYADDVAVRSDGRVYFTDASTKFGAKAHGGTYPASVLDTFEHGRHGRLLRYDVATGEASLVRGDLAFANGVALSADESVLFVNETGLYRVLTLQVAGPKAGQWGVLIDELPGFPDNIETGRDGTLWLGLVVPRNALLDGMSDKPWLRKVVFRLPALIRPKAASYGHLLALSEAGEVLQDLQSEQAYTHVTGAVHTGSTLFVTSLTEPTLGRMQLPAPNAPR